MHVSVVELPLYGGNLADHMYTLFLSLSSHTHTHTRSLPHTHTGTHKTLSPTPAVAL